MHCSPNPLDLSPSENAGPGRSPRMGTTQTEGSWGHFFPVLSFMFCSFLCPPNLQPMGAGGQRSVCSDPATDQAVSLATVPVSLGAGGRLCARNSLTPHPATSDPERRLRVKPRPPRLPGGPPAQLHVAGGIARDLKEVAWGREYRCPRSWGGGGGYVPGGYLIL